MKCQPHPETIGRLNEKTCHPLSEQPDGSKTGDVCCNMSFLDQCQGENVKSFTFEQHSTDFFHGKLKDR